MEQNVTNQNGIFQLSVTFLYMALNLEAEGLKYFAETISISKMDSREINAIFLNNCILLHIVVHSTYCSYITYYYIPSYIS